VRHNLVTTGMWRIVSSVSDSNLLFCRQQEKPIISSRGWVRGQGHRRMVTPTLQTDYTATDSPVGDQNLLVDACERCTHVGLTQRLGWCTNEQDLGCGGEPSSKPGFDGENWALCNYDTKAV